MASSRVPLDTRLYRACLNGLPLVFRRDCSDQMLNDFDDHRTDAIESGRVGAIWLFRLRMLRDMFRALTVQWVRTGWPVIGGLAMMMTLVSTSALASVWQRLGQEHHGESSRRIVGAVKWLGDTQRPSAVQ